MGLGADLCVVRWASQLMKSMAKYMAPMAKTKWKKPYPYGTSSGSASVFLNWGSIRERERDRV